MHLILVAMLQMSYATLASNLCKKCYANIKCYYSYAKLLTMIARRCGGWEKKKKKKKKMCRLGA